MVELFQQVKLTPVTGTTSVLTEVVVRPGFQSQWLVKIVRQGYEGATVLVKQSERLMSLDEANKLHREWIAELNRHNRRERRVRRR